MDPRVLLAEEAPSPSLPPQGVWISPSHPVLVTGFSPAGTCHEGSAEDFQAFYPSRAGRAPRGQTAG